MLKFNWSTSWYTITLSSNPRPTFYSTIMPGSVKCQKNHVNTVLSYSNDSSTPKHDNLFYKSKLQYKNGIYKG